MALGINTNIASITAQNQLGKSQAMNSQALERLSSGLRINSAKDDAAGLSISTRLDAQVRGLSVAQRNANDGISMMQTAEGGLEETTNNLQRMRELAVQSANGTLDDTKDRVALNAEFQARLSEIDRVATQTKFNGISVLDNANTVDIQVGADANQTITVTFADMQAGALNGGTGLGDITNAANAQTAIDAIDAALDEVSAQRGQFGALQNRFESAINNIATSIENQSAANSRIVDADFAAESAKLAKSNVLQQAGISVLAQANARPNQVLSLLQ
jgi:flagellin